MKQKIRQLLGRSFNVRNGFGYLYYIGEPDSLPRVSTRPSVFITQIGEVISFLRNQKTIAIVLVEQYFDFAFGLADQIYAVKRGEVVYESKKSTIDKSKLRTSVGV